MKADPTTLSLDKMCCRLVRCYHNKLLDVHPAFIHVVAGVRAAGPQSMVLERYIGVYEKIVCSTRVSLQEQQIDDIMTIKMNLPALADFDLRPLVHDWLSDTKRKPQKKFDVKNVRKHERYRGFFPESKTRQRRVIAPGNEIEEDLVESDIE